MPEEIGFVHIAKANRLSGKPIKLKGKEYTPVFQRIKAFRRVFPCGFIKTELASNENGVCIFRAFVGYKSKSGEECVLGVGTACEKENSSMVNRTNYIENCETSAVGRALGMAGFGIETSIASAEDMYAVLNTASRVQNGKQKTLGGV